MNEQFLTQTALFHGIHREEIEQLLSCLLARKKTYSRDEIIFSAGTNIHEMGLVLSGGVNIVANFYWGSQSIFSHISRGEIFGENYAAIPGEALLVDVVATEKSEILFLDLNKLLHTCQNCCAFHTQLIHNLLKISAQRSIHLSRRMMHTAPKTIRGRLNSYLSEQAVAHDSAHFSIPFNRQQLADYLNVDRSALSNELSKMRDEGLLQFRKNEFALEEIPQDEY